MKIQNHTTIEQAQRLDDAIREAGLSWPDIEWECAVYKWTQNLQGDQPKLVLRVCDVDAINQDAPPAFQYIPLGIPAPNVAELAAMIPERYGNMGKIVTYDVPIFDIETLIKIIARMILYSPDYIKAHWETL